MKTKQFLGVLAVFITTACQHDVTMVEVMEQQMVEKVTKKEYTTQVSKDDVLRVAEIFNGGSSTTRSVKTIKELAVVYDDAGMPTFYVVNYEDNQGFILVSATKNYLPVLAYNNTGNFSTSVDSHPEALQLWIKEIKGSIGAANKQLADSTVNYRALWQRYEEQTGIFVGAAQTRGTTEAVDDMIMSYISQWNSEGYDCSLLVDMEQSLPSDVYSRFCATAESSTLPTYDWTQYAVVRNKYIEEVEVVNNILSTTWDKDYWTDLTINPAVMAVAQSMKYYEYPTSLNWNGISNQEYTAELKTFISELKTAFNNQYTTSKIATILNSYGYVNAKTATHSTSTVSFNLAQKRPVIMTGTNSAGVYYTWVAAGYKDIDYSHPYELFVPTYEDTFACVDSYLELSGSNFYIYMNWGDGGVGDGFYTESASTYTQSRQDVVNIYH